MLFSEEEKREMRVGFAIGLIASLLGGWILIILF